MGRIICNRSLRLCSKPQMKKETSENIYPVFLPAAFGIGRDPFFFGYNFRTDKTGFIDFSANQIFTAITVGRGAE